MYSHSPLIAVNEGLKYLLLVKHFKLLARLSSNIQQCEILWPCVLRNNLLQQDKMDARPQSFLAGATAPSPLNCLFSFFNLFLILANQKTFQIAYILRQHHVLQNKVFCFLSCFLIQIAKLHNEVTVHRYMEPAQDFAVKHIHTNHIKYTPPGAQLLFFYNRATAIHCQKTANKVKYKLKI